MTTFRLQNQVTPFKRPPAKRIKAKRYSLSERELDVLYLLMYEGPFEQAIADRLSEPTEAVAEDIGRILEKLDARSRTEAALRAFREGIFH